jgi:peroxiredoxin
MLQDIYKQHRDQGLEVLAISTDGPETQPGVRPFVREHGLTFPVLLDTEARAGARYNPQNQIPLMLIFDSKGHIIYSHASFQAGQVQVLRNKILELLAVDKK